MLTADDEFPLPTTCHRNSSTTTTTKSTTSAHDPGHVSQSLFPSFAAVLKNGASHRPGPSFTSMHLTEKGTSGGTLATTTTATTTAAVAAASTNLHHSPGSASTSSSSSSSSRTGYTRELNPRPRAHKPHSTTTTGATATTTATVAMSNIGSSSNNGNNATTTTAQQHLSQPPTIISTLPPSALSAAPYIPSSMVHHQGQHMVDYSQGVHYVHHPVQMAPAGYAYMAPTMQGCPDGPPPQTGMPPPPLNPAGGTTWIQGYYPTPVYDSMPPFVHHITPPTPSASSSGSTSISNKPLMSQAPPPPHPAGPPPNVATPTFCHTHPPAVVTSQAGHHTPPPPSVPVSSCAGSPGLQQPPPPPPPQAQQYVVSYHLQQGEVISLRLGDGQVEVIQGPANIRMVSTNSTPPLAMPMQVPPGHMVQQIIDQNGTLQHVILAPDPLAAHHPQGPPPPPGSTTYVQQMNPYSPSSAGATSPSGPPPLGPMGSSGTSSGYASATTTMGSPPSAANSTTTSRFPNTQYGPPPGGPLHPAGGGSGAHTPTPTSHGTSPTPSSSSGNGQPPSWAATSSSAAAAASSTGSYHAGSDRRVRDPTHERLLKKTRARQQQQMMSAVTPPVSPAKRGGRDYSHGSGSDNKAGSKNGSGSKMDSRQHDDSEESGVGHEEEEEMHQLIVELLSNIRTPKVSEIDARSALLKWGPPVRDQSDSKFEALEHIQDKHFIYEVLLSDKGKDGSYRSIFTGPSIECRLTDLRPCTEYHIRIHAIYDNLKGGVSDTVSFQTDACEPDKPMPPKMIARTKTSINLKWISPMDNGAHIQHYILEYDEGRGKFHQPGSYNQQPYGGDTGGYGRATHDDKCFVPLITTRAKCYNVSKLRASTFYRFRLVAVNELGRSLPSEAVTFATQGSAPSQPQPPGLKEATKSSLHLVWTKRPCDSEFILHMDDQISGHGFLPVYTGCDLQHITTGLRRNASYKFRLQSVNEEGKSPWSEDVAFLTLPDVPGPPLRPASKGRIHAHAFKVRWDPPHDNGGSPIEHYILEIDGGQGWQTSYQGPNTECSCDQLIPGTQYKVRVACTSAGGVSNYSEICHICTEPICPGQCAPPRPHGKPKASSIHLKWGWPDSDGGSPVTEFEIDMTTPDNKTMTVYRGRDTECVVASLMPGRFYLFQVRAHNRVGAGPWSESLEVVSGAGSPDQPKPPRLSSRSPTSIHLEWDAPINNGASITEYIVHMALIASRKCLSPPPSIATDDNVHSEDEEGLDSSLSSKSSNYDDSEDDEELQDGEDNREEVDHESQDSDDEDDERPQERKRKKKILSSSRRRSHDSDVEEEESDGHEDQTKKKTSAKKTKKVEPNQQQPSSSKEGPEIETMEPHPVEPEFVQIYAGIAMSFDARNVHPASTYAFRLAAVNAAGMSVWSSVSEISTAAAPPAAVSGLELQSATANSLVLAWQRPAANGEPITHYFIDIASSNPTGIQTSGPETTFTLNGLRPDSAYTIRVQAVNSVGPGPFCPTSRFCTRPLPPAPPRCECVSAGSNSLKLKWGEGLRHTTGELSKYTLEMATPKNQFQTVYSGTGLSHKVIKLNENQPYRFRICASNEAGQGPYSKIYEFSTSYAHPPPVKVAPKVSCITDDGCLVDWSGIKMPPMADSRIHFKVQLTKVKDNENKIIYNGGHDTQFRVNGLDARTEYAIRVAGVRVPTGSDVELEGLFSPPAIFNTSSNDSGHAGSGSYGGHTSGSTSGGKSQSASAKLGLFQNKNDKSWSDKAKAFSILIGFTIFALFVPFIFQQIIA